MSALDLREIYFRLRNNLDANSSSSEALGNITLKDLARLLSEACIETSQDWHRKPNGNDVDELFRLILKRDVEDTKAYTNHLSANSVRELLSTILDSDEHKINAAKEALLSTLQLDIDFCSDSRKQFILFGAYGNGNLGDAEQAQCISYFLKESGLSTTDIASTSWENRDYSYPFSERKLPYNAILDPERISNASMIVIGGGGLLGTPHFPLHNERWLDFIIGRKVPYVLWSVGGGHCHLSDINFEAAYNKLISHASLVAARDEESYVAISKIRSDAIFLEDPVYAANIQQLRSIREGGKIHAILKHPVNDCESQFVNHIRNYYRSDAGKNLTVSFLEPCNPNERQIMNDFPGCRTAKNIKELDHVLTGARLGVTMRLHGAAVMARNGLKLIGVCQPKIRALLERYGIKDQFFDRGFEDVLAIMRDDVRIESIRSADISQDLIKKLREDQLSFARTCISLAR
ncbi:polysaccharide pyruvyl transferase family protein [Methylorubrum extorquens]|uniref:Polysaccharide pyruvyl transferase domain-containing protein n=1 Tax=Methylorubrum extorquens DSM 13060 TaxID=882800 RepID=H1KM64_METEX|nr:polysaccharide pyruvyl transferase family protein [Methylorubrum extorquens]EHP91383.1 hypothetical protein MetexDRAFT_3727 [Methylorubrum extorquens DSM 13060]